MKNMSLTYEGIEIEAGDGIEAIEAKIAAKRIAALELEITDLSLMKNEALQSGINASNDIRACLRDRKIAALESELLNALTIAN